MSQAVLPTSHAQSMRQKAMTALIIGGVSIGGSPIFVRLSEVGPIATGFWRLALAVIPLFFLARRERRGEAATLPSARDWLWLLVPGLFIAGDLGAWHLSLSMTSVANATLLANLAPIFVTIGAWLLFGARVAPVFVAGLVVAIAGVVTLKGGPGGLLHSQTSAGDAVALLAAVFYAGYMLSVGRLRGRFATARIVLWSSLAGAILILPVALMVEGQIFPHSLFGWTMLLGLAWLSHAAGQSLIVFALAYLPTSFSSLTLLLQPVISALLAWLLLAEPLGFMQALGGVVVIAGILIARRG